ncbi:hypothetical protein [Microbulbifer sp. ZKSA002]|uniref:hypothetical protein n=1 Tax=Microbulbifer sp. ZKSA002 TaxID=3243388 RepID=UPI004039D7B0
MAKLEKIEITNIKGISYKLFDLQLFPNKPSILVAPNGFGKSSIACAFKSMNNARVDLADSNHFNKDTTKSPSIAITYDGTKYIATNSSNEISSIFDISVINNHVVPDAKKKRIGNFTTVSTSLKVTSVVLIDNIPANVAFSYKYTNIKSSFGSGGKALPNATHLLSDTDFLRLIDREINFTEYTKKRTYIRLIEPLVNTINSYKGTSAQIRDYINANLISQLRAIGPLKALASLVQKSNGHTEVEAFLIAWQIAFISNTASFKSAMQYQLYIGEKKFFDDLLSSADTTRHKIKTKEEKATGTKKRLVVNFPDADEISNGQRDILSFIAQIQRSLKKLKKQNCILIIDEIFDYLDDANLVAFQYYVTQVIDGFKKQGRSIFPLLLTHLDPACFKHFCFNKHRLQTKHLNRNTSSSESVFLKLVKNRTDPSIEDDLSKHHFHYHPTDKDLETDFTRLSMRKAWGKSHSFYSVVYKEAEKYLKGAAFDAIAVLFAIRIKIEELAFARLAGQAQKDEFLDGQHGTSNKLDYCESIGVSIPETHYLLGLIYNDNLHWNPYRDYETPLISKLENFTIKKMIREVFS